jgi:hypothetical protein
MGDTLVRFRSPGQPAHYVRSGRGFKFVGGRLAVAPSEAEIVRAYALANPGFGIVEEASPRPPRKQPATEDDA